MSARPNPADDLRRIDLEAAGWLVKHDRGFTATEQDEFFQWLALDPRHGEWMARHRQSWQALDLLAQWRPEHSTDPNPDLLARSPAKAARRKRLARVISFWAVGLAAAATIALLFAFAPEKAAPRPVAPVPVVAKDYERRTLEDGSVVELNRGAAIAVTFTAAERRVALLQGEALFSVAKNPARPFIVRAGGVDVRAVGTAFNVRLGSANVEVLVTEGRVQIGHPDAALPNAESEVPHVSAGQRAIVPLAPDRAPQIAPVSAAEIAHELAWQPQLLDFSSAPLGHVIAEFNRRNRIQLVLADPELAELPIVASIRSDNVEGLVRLLAATDGLRAEHRSATEIVLHVEK